MARINKRAQATYMRRYWKTRDKAAYYKQRRVAVRALIDAVKNRPCKLCGGRFPSVCMDLHHRIPSMKMFGIGHSAARGLGLETVSKEIEKCDVYCANCHRIITHTKEK